MQIRRKLLNSIKYNVEKIEKNTFDEYTIKCLLIDIRDLTKTPIIREIGDFIAHPTREKGISCDKMNNYCFQWKYANLEDCVNIPFPIEKIPKKEFELLKNVILNTEPEFFNNNTGLNNQEGFNKLQSCYKKKSGYFKLIKPKRITTINNIIQSSMRSISISPIIDQDELINELIEEVCNITSIDVKKIFLNFSNEITLCILSFLQSAFFVSYDKEKLKCAVSKDSNDNYLQLTGCFHPNYLRYPIVVPLISTHTKYEDYFKENEMTFNFHIIRDNNNKLITKHFS